VWGWLISTWYVTGTGSRKIRYVILRTRTSHITDNHFPGKSKQTVLYVPGTVPGTVLYCTVLYVIMMIHDEEERESHSFPFFPRLAPGAWTQGDEKDEVLSFRRYEYLLELPSHSKSAQTK
jgi:hypothetical protein